MKCQELFENDIRNNCPKLDSAEVWRHFITELTSAIHGIGANTYHLLTNGVFERDPDWLGKFTTSFDIGEIDGLRKAMAHFFAATNSAARHYLLRILSAYFFAEATRLTPQTLQLIDKGRSTRKIKIILDTNFIFSILGLHDNPANEAAMDLVSLAATSGKNLDIHLYVLPGTIEEATRVLAAQSQSIARIQTSRAMSNAALSAPLSGIAARFFRAANDSPGLTTNVFFDPYLNGLKQILEAKKVSVLEAHPSVYNIRQDVIDDVMGQLDREQNYLPENRHKSYEAWLHDVVLWHVINDHRSSVHNSPFDVEYWAVSIDWRLITFDRTKRDTLKLPVPTVLHPTNLIQLLQFWLPRSESLEATLVDSLRLPLFFRDFDAEDERATIKILQALSRYENIDDLPESSIPPLLANQALRNRLKEGDIADDQMIALVREELLIEHNRALANLAQKEDALKEVTQDLKQVRLTATSVAEKLTEAQSVEQALSKALKQSEETLSAEKSERQRLAQLNEDYLLSVKKNNFLFFYFVIPLVLTLLSGALATFFIAWSANLKIYAITLSIVLPILGAVWASESYLNKTPVLNTWWFARLFKWTRALIVSAFLLAIIAIWQTGIIEVIKNFF